MATLPPAAIAPAARCLMPLMDTSPIPGRSCALRWLESSPFRARVEASLPLTYQQVLSMPPPASDDPHISPPAHCVIRSEVYRVEPEEIHPQEGLIQSGGASPPFAALDVVQLPPSPRATSTPCALASARAASAPDILARSVGATFSTPAATSLATRLAITPPPQ